MNSSNKTSKSALQESIITQVLDSYGITPDNCTVTPLGDGLINNTFLVKSLHKKLVLQQINNTVFTAPINVISNADLISQHLCEKHACGKYDLAPIWQHKNVSGQSHTTISGEHWRALEHIENSYTLASIQDAEQAHEVANAFAHFSSTLIDFDCSQLHCIIPNFHDLPSCIGKLTQAMAQASKQKLNETKELREFIESQQHFIQIVADTVSILPRRVTHNDTKINNLLFSKDTKKPLAVIDLDTCMSGYLMHDFGDMVRSCCSQTAENDSQLSNMSIDFEIVHALAQGYLNGFSSELLHAEKQSLLIGVKLMPFMLSIRFLTDYLNDDQYFQIDYAQHNLVRAKIQLHLYRLFCQKDALLTQAILEQ